MFDDYANDSDNSRGVAYPAINDKKFLRALIPLPPISEQARIVECLNEILPEIGNLKKDETELDALQKSFPKKIKESILQYAVQGKLTEQLPEDGDVRDLLDEIQKEKTRLISEGKIKKQKPLPEIKADEIPFDIPDNWSWTRLGDVTEIIMGQSPEGSSVSENKGIEFHQGKIYFTDKIIKDTVQRCSKPKKIAPADSVLLCVRAPVGIVNMTNRDICIGRGLACIKGLRGIYIEYLFNYLRTMRKYYHDRSTGSTFKAINQDIIKESILPLPPLAEQKRIVERLDQLLPLCRAID